MNFKLILFILLVFGNLSCRSIRQLPVEQTTASMITAGEQTQEFIVDHMKSDSAQLYASLQVSESGQVSLQEILRYSPGENVTPEIQIRDNYIYVKCRVDSAEVYRKYSKFIIHTDTATQSVILSAPGLGNTRCRDTGFFHRALHTAGYLFLAEILVLAGFLIYLKLTKRYFII